MKFIAKQRVQDLAELRSIPRVNISEEAPGQLGRLGGMIDGEGTFHIEKSLRPEFSMSQKDGEFLIRLVAKYGLGTICVEK